MNAKAPLRASGWDSCLLKRGMWNIVATSAELSHVPTKSARQKCIAKKNKANSGSPTAGLSGEVISH